MVGFLIYDGVHILAEEKKKLSSKPKLKSKKTQTVRERTTTTKVPKKRVRNTVKKATTPLKSIKKLHAKEYHLPLPDNKVGKVLKKRVRIFPKFVVEAFREVRQVTWPNRRETIKLTFAVFIFAIVFASIVGLLDYGLSKAFEKFFVK
jgi:preprotein translocase SecE subunit